MAFHVSNFNENPSEWAWYHNTLMGTGAFTRNTWKPTSAVMQTENQDHPAVAGMPNTWRSQPSEWYAWNNDLRNNPKIKILLSIHSSSFPVGTDPNQSWYSGYFPISWVNTDYRFIYYNVGHNDIDYSNGNADLSHTFGDSVQDRYIFQAWRWLSEGRFARRDVSPRMVAFDN